MPFTIIAASGLVISAKISGKLSKSEMSQVQAAALRKISALFILEDLQAWKRERE